MAERFNIEPHRSINSKLKLDGYYNSITPQTHFPFFKRAIFFENGTVYYDEALLTEIEFEEKVQNKDFIFGKRKDITKWGVFTASDGNIEVEIRMSDYHAPVITFSGIILNDTSFNLRKAVIKKKIYHINYVLVKRQLLSKPDSTNNFVR